MFLNNLKVEKVAEQTYILLDDLIYKNNEAEFIFKSGFDFDAISIPKIFWSLIDSPFTGKAVRSATGHDVLYSVEFQNNRKLCDDLFLEMMTSDGVNFFKRYAMYYAVRAFRWYVWMKHDKMEVQEYKKFVEVKYENIIY